MMRGSTRMERKLSRKSMIQTATGCKAELSSILRRYQNHGRRLDYVSSYLSQCAVNKE